MRVYPHFGFDFAIPTMSPLDLGDDSRPSEPFPPLAVVPLPYNEPSVPSQQRFRSDDTGNFCQKFPAKRLTLYREPTSLVIRQTKLPPAKPSLEDSVLFEQVDDSRLLVTLEPTQRWRLATVSRGWIGVLITGDSSFHWRTKPRRL